MTEAMSGRPGAGVPGSVVYVGDTSGAWHLLGARDTTLCGRRPRGWPAEGWPHRTGDAGRVGEDDLCRMCLRVARRRGERRRYTRE
jgi:hypothetical protein